MAIGRATIKRHALSSLLAMAASLFLAACSNGAVERAHYPMKSDAKPHDGVRTAQNFPVHGIDISKWQGEIDWVEVKRAGTAFAFIKSTEGGDHLDEKFAENWRGAKAAGVPRAAYHFVFWCRPAHEQAAWFKKHIPADPDALPPVLDVEWNGHSRTCPKKIDSDLARKKIAVMLKAMEEHTGKKPIIYTDIPFHADVMEGHFKDYPYWLRSVAAKPEERYENRPWTFWQYTTTGRVPGIKGPVDRNAFAGSRAQWNEWLRKNGVRP